VWREATVPEAGKGNVDEVALSVLEEENLVRDFHFMCSRLQVRQMLLSHIDLLECKAQLYEV
jgi:hypothetical protein